MSYGVLWLSCFADATCCDLVANRGEIRKFQAGHVILEEFMTNERDSYSCMLRPIDADADVLETILTSIAI